MIFPSGNIITSGNISLNPPRSGYINDNNSMGERVSRWIVGGPGGLTGHWVAKAAFTPQRPRPGLDPVLALV